MFFFEIRKFVWWVSICILSLIIFTLCQSKKSNSVNLKVDGETFYFPDSVEVIQDNKVLAVPLNEVFELNQDILVSIIQGNCHICLQKVNQVAELFHAEHLSGIQSLIIIRTDNPDYFIRAFLPKLIIAPSILIIDSKERFYSLNNLTDANAVYNTFVIDRNGKMLAIGDPFYFTETYNYIVKMYGDNQCND